MAADGHRADAQLACDAPQRPALQHPQEQDRGLIGRKPLQQRFCRNAEAFCGCWLFALGGGEMVEERTLVGTVSIEALMAPGVNSLLVLTVGDPHQAAVIVQVMLQGSVDTLLEEEQPWCSIPA